MEKPLTILYFAWLRERIGTASEEVVLPDGVRTVSALVDLLSARSPGHESAFRNRRTVRAAVNQEFADPSGPSAPRRRGGVFPAGHRRITPRGPWRGTWNMIISRHKMPTKSSRIVTDLFAQGAGWLAANPAAVEKPNAHVIGSLCQGSVLSRSSRPRLPHHADT